MSNNTQEEWSFEKGAIIDRYEIARAIGQGGMGEVYEARDMSLGGKKVAIKILSSKVAQNNERIERFTREAFAAANIGHDGICDVTDMGIHSTDTPFIVMEYLEGQSLEDLLSQEGRLSSKLAVEIIQQVLSALSAAHQKGIIHRDLKPDNIFLTRNSRNGVMVKLLDFGVAKFVEDDGRSTRLTQEATVIGTPSYMSPEQVQGYSERIDKRSDLFGVGVVLFELLTGQLPFDGTSNNLVMIQIARDRAPDPREIFNEVPNELANIVNRALQREKPDRFQDAEEFMRALDKASFATPSSQPEPLPEPVEPKKAKTMSMERPATRQQKWRLPALVATLCLVILGSTAIAFHFAMQSTEATTLPVEHQSAAAVIAIPEPTDPETATTEPEIQPPPESEPVKIEIADPEPVKQVRVRSRPIKARSSQPDDPPFTPDDPPPAKVRDWRPPAKVRDWRPPVVAPDPSLIATIREKED
ncbi:MAG: protein kinase [Parcubacteria group bacterium]|nr:protein kinase [Parcubacteria group bacterium]